MDIISYKQNCIQIKLPNFFKRHLTYTVIHSLHEIGQLSGNYNFLQKLQFCRTFLYLLIVILVIFARYFSNRIKYFVRHNVILTVLSDRLALFAKTAYMICMQ